MDLVRNTEAYLLETWSSEVRYTVNPVKYK